MMLALIGIFVVVWSIQMVYWFFFRKNGQALIAKKVPKQAAELGVSVIICGKNEAKNIQAFLYSICEQRYPLFEVIYIDDGSTDTTQEALQALQKKYPHLKSYVHKNARNWKGKKSALDYGIGQAQYPCILVTDADCKASSPYWIKNMMLHYHNNIVLGYAPYYSPKTNFLHKWIQWETMHTFIQYSSYAHGGNAYMGVGRNMLYPKAMYQKAVANTAFTKMYGSIPSGDDDLLIQEIRKHCPVAICMAADTLMYSPAPTEWAAYWQQKSRHASTGKFYHKKIQYLLGLYGITHGVMWLTGIILLIYLTLAYFIGAHNPLSNDSSLWYILCITVGALIARLVLKSSTFNSYYKCLHRQQQGRYFLLFEDMFWAIYNLILSPYIFIKNKQQWKS